MFKAARLFVRELLATAKSQYYNNKIIDCNGNQKTVFSVVNKVLHRKTTVFPDIFDSDKEMAEEFNTFVYQKIQKIRDGFPPTNLTHVIPSDPCHSSLSTCDDSMKNRFYEKHNRFQTYHSYLSSLRVLWLHSSRNTCLNSI